MLCQVVILVHQYDQLERMRTADLPSHPFLCALVNYNKLPVPVYYPSLSDSNDAVKWNVTGCGRLVTTCCILLQLSQKTAAKVTAVAANTSLVLKTVCDKIC